MSNQWTNAWTFPFDKKPCVEYNYAIVQKDGNKEKIVLEEKISRKIDLKKLDIDFSKKDSSITILSSIDSWDSTENSKHSLTQVPLSKEKTCLILGSALNVDLSLKPQAISKIEKLQKIIREDPKRYKFSILTGISQQRLKKFETIAMFDYGVKMGIDQQFLNTDIEAKTTIENAIFYKIKLAKLGIIEFDLILSKGFQKKALIIYREVFDHPIFMFSMVNDG